MTQNHTDSGRGEKFDDSVSEYDELLAEFNEKKWELFVEALYADDAVQAFAQTTPTGVYVALNDEDDLDAVEAVAELFDLEVSGKEPKHGGINVGFN